MTQGPLGRRFKKWFWRPPRPHGEIVVDRTVSFLELFYDLVYVAVIAQAAHHLAEDPSGRSFVEFAVVFTVIWIAWVNGSLYLELHGREDGRTRTVVFVQIRSRQLAHAATAVSRCMCRRHSPYSPTARVSPWRFTTAQASRGGQGTILSEVVG